MGKFVEDMLRAKYGFTRDGRNPYGSRGGYVVSSRGRDRAMDDYARRDMEYGYDMARGGRGSRGGRDYEGYEEDMRRRDMRERESQDYGRDYHYPYGGGMGYGYPPYDYGYDMARNDMRGGRDYGDDDMEFGKMSKKDYEHWKKELKNEDGSHGEHWKKEQLEQVARQMGIDVHSLGGIDVLAMTVNMMYSDYCAVAKKYGVDRPEYYVDLAKAFLQDKDYKGDGEQKLWYYYQCIVKED